MAIEQTYLFNPDLKERETYKEKLVALLSSDLDFHGENSGFKSHNFHSFPAKFPPQLPRKFINELTIENEIVLDPMVGSGTTVLEALLAHRYGIGLDIDPLALKISTVKVTALNLDHVVATGKDILEEAKRRYSASYEDLLNILEKKWDSQTKEFIDYWFAVETQAQLLALITEIQKIPDLGIRKFFELVFSATIITKSGGVSFALDLAHTRPHKAKYIVSKSGDAIAGERKHLHSGQPVKILRSAFEEFEKRLRNNLNGLIIHAPKNVSARILCGNAELLPIPSESVDLIVTSPPYASNAIDYMRAHKFSLVWMGYEMGTLSNKRKTYIGAETTSHFKFEEMPPSTEALLEKIAKVDEAKSVVVRRYYSEMSRSLKEMYRVLKPQKAAIVVVGSSTIRGTDTETQNCLADLGKAIGFEVPKIGVRNLDRNKRMLPAGQKIDKNSQIQQRMHQEFVIGFYKP